MTHIPYEVFQAARPGDTVSYRLRGPATKEEIAELAADLEVTYPGVQFEITAGHAQSNAHIVATGG